MPHSEVPDLAPFVSNLTPRLIFHPFQQKDIPENYLPDDNQDLSAKPSLILLQHFHIHSSRNTHLPSKDVFLSMLHYHYLLY